jgi:DNA-binding response OmpR family regulator
VASRPEAFVYGGGSVKVLLIEDSPRLQRSIGTALRQSGYEVEVTGDGEEGLWHAQSRSFAVIILDLMLPGLDGLSILRHLRGEGDRAPILILTAKDTVEDRVCGLRSGADDYLIKPFALEELLARVDALARRGHGLQNGRIQVGDLEIDTVTKQVSRSGRLIALPPREFALLELLALRLGQVVSRIDIESNIYGDRVEPSSNVVESAVYSLRRRIDRSGEPSLIETRRGYGYLLRRTAR